MMHFAARADWSADEDDRLPYLLSAGAKIDLRAEPRHPIGEGLDWTPLMVAAKMGHAAQVKWFVANGACISARDSAGMSAYDIATDVWNAVEKLPLLR